MSDIEVSLKEIGRVVLDVNIKAGAHDSWSYPLTGRFSNSTTSVTDDYLINCELTVRCGTGVRVTNPNLFLANQLGLLDLALPWKLVPFSFIVDWFINVEQCISSVTDWYGLELINPWYSIGAKGSQSRKFRFRANYAPGSYEYRDIDWLKKSMELRRYQGLLGPSLVIRPFKGFSLERGAQAIALVISVFDKSPYSRK